MLEESKIPPNPVPPGRRQGVNASNAAPLPNATLESAFKKQELELLKYQFENKLLVNKLERTQVNVSGNKDPNAKRNIARVQDVELNYNTKTNYVTILEHKIAELNDLLFREKREGEAARERELELELANEKKNYKDLREKYRAMKVRYAELRKHKSMFDSTLNASRKMRAVLKAFNETGLLTKPALKDLDLDFYDKVLDGRRDPYNPEKGASGPATANLSAANDSEFRDILARKDKQILQLRSQLKEGGRVIEEKHQQLKDQKVKSSNIMTNKLFALKENFRQASADLTEKHLQEVQGFGTQVLSLEGDRHRHDQEARQAAAALESRALAAEDALFKKDLELKEQTDSYDVLKQKFKTLTDKLQRAARENQSFVSKLMASQIKASSISREAISRSLFNLRQNGASGVGQSEGANRVMVDLGVEELKKIEEDLNKYEELGGNFEALKEVNIELNARLKDQEEELRQFEERADAAESARRALEAKVALVAHDGDGVQAKNAALQKQLADAEAAAEETGKLVHNLKEKIIDISAQLAGARLAISHKETELVHTQTDLKAREDEVADLKSRLDGVKGELKGLAKQSGEQRNAAEGSARELEELRFAREQLSARVLDLEAGQERMQQAELENSRLVEELAHKEINLKATIAELHNLRAELGNLQKIIKEKQEKFRGKIKDGLRQGGEAEGTAAEQIRILHGLTTLKDEELAGLRELLAAAEAERTRLEAANAAWQTRFNALSAEQQTYARQIRELSRIKAVFDDLKSGQGDYVSLKMAHLELQEELVQLKEFVASANKELDLARAEGAADKTAVQKLEAHNAELEARNNEHLGGIMLLEEQKAALADRVDDFSRMVEQLQKRLEEKSFEAEEARRQLESLKNLAADRGLVGVEDLGEETVEVHLAKIEKDRLTTLLLEAEKVTTELKALVKESEIKLKAAEDELAAVQIKNKNETNWAQLILEKDLQIIDMARFGNEKTEALEATNHRLLAATAQLRNAEEQISILEERLNVRNDSVGLLVKMHDVTLLTYREKYNITHRENNTPQELIKLYDLIETANEEIEFYKSGSNARDEDNPLFKRLKAQLEAARSQIDGDQDVMSRLNGKVAELESDLSKVRGERREAEERAESRYREVERLMAQIGELSVTRTHHEQQIDLLRAEVRRLETADHSKDSTSKRGDEERSKLKLEINALVIDKKLLNDKIANLHEALKDKDLELSRARDEYFDVQENFINATEEFLQKLDDEKDRNARLELRQAELQSELEGRATSGGQSQALNRQLQADNNKLQGKVAALTDTVELLRRTVQLNEEQLDNGERVYKLEKHVTELEGQLAELAGKFAGADGEREELVRWRAGSEALVKDLQHRLAIKSAENEDYEEMILEMRTSMRTQAAAPKQIPHDVEKIVLSEKIKQLEKTISDYRQKLDAFEMKASASFRNLEAVDEEVVSQEVKEVKGSEGGSKHEEMMQIVKKRLEQVKEVEAKLARREQEIRRLEEELPKLQQENAKLTAQIKNQKNFKNLPIKKESRAAQEKHAHEIEALNKQIEASNKQVEELGQRLNEKTGEIEEFSQRLKDKAVEVEDLREQLKAKTEEVQAVVEAKAASAIQFEDNRAEIKLTELTTKVQRKKEKIGVLKSEANDLKVNIEGLREVEQRLAFVSEQLAIREHKYNELEKRYNELEEAMQKEAFSTNKTQLLLTQKNSELVQLRAENGQIEQLSLENRNLAASLGQAKRALEEAEEALSASKKNYSELKQKYEALENQRSDLKYGSKQKDNELSQLKDQLDEDLRQKERELARLKNQFNDNLEQKEYEVAQLKDRLAAQDARLKKYEGLIRSLEENNDKSAVQMEHEIGLLRQSLNEAISTSQAVYKKIEQERAENLQLRDENVILRQATLASTNSLTAQLTQVHDKFASQRNATEKLQLEIQTLHSEKAELQNQNELLQNRMSDLEEEFVALNVGVDKQLCAFLEEENVQLSDQLTNFQNQNEQLRIRAIGLEEELAILQASLERVQQSAGNGDNDQLARIISLEQMINDKEIDISRKTAEIEDLHNKLASAYESGQRHASDEKYYALAGDAMGSQITALEQDNQQLIIQNNDLNNQLNEATAQVKQLKAEVKLLEASIEALNNDKKHTHESHAKDVEVKKVLISELQTQLQRLKEKEAFAQKEIQKMVKLQLSLENERNLLRSRFEESREAQRAWEAEKRQAGDAGAVHAALMDALKEENSSLEQTVTSLTAKVAVLTAEKDRLNAHLKDCRENLQRQRAENEAQSQELISLHHNMTGLEEYIERASSAFETSSVQNKALRQEVGRLRQALAEKEGQIIELEISLQRITDMGAQQGNLFAEEIGSQREAIVNLYDDIATLEAKLEDLLGDRDRLRLEVKNLQRENESLKVERQRSVEEKQDLVQKFNTQRDSLASLQSRHSEFQNTLIKSDREKLDFARQRAEIAELKDELAHAKDQQEKLEHIVGKYRASNANLADENKNLMKELDEANDRSKNVQSAGDNERETIEGLVSERDKLSQEKDRLEKALTQVNKQNVVLEGMVQDQKADIAEMQSSLEEIHEQLMRKFKQD